MLSIIRNACDLHRYVSPVEFANRERIEYRLGSFKSRIATELLQVAVRKQAVVFGLSDELVAAQVDAGKKLLHIDVQRLNEWNDRIKQGVTTDVAFQIRLLQRFHICKQQMDIVAARFKAGVHAGKDVSADLIEYFDLVTSYHELGILKFCFPDRLARREIADTMRGDRRLLGDLLRPRGVSLFYELHVQRLKLALSRLTQVPAIYDRDVERFREEYGFLGAEDMDFRDHDAPGHWDAEIARIIQLYRSDANAIRSRLDELERQSVVTDADRSRAWNAFYSRLGQTDSRVFRLNLLVLNEQLISHEESNRLCKMRFFRDLSLLLESRGLDPFKATIVDAITSNVDPRGQSSAQWS